MLERPRHPSQESASASDYKAQLAAAREAQGMAEAARNFMAGTFVEKEAVITELRNATEALEAQVWFAQHGAGAVPLMHTA